MAWAALALGVVLVIGTWASLVSALVVPRGYSSRLAGFVGRRLIGGSFKLAADRLRSYEAKDRVLALWGPLWLLSLFVVWLFGFFLGFGLILWPLRHGSFGGALRESGSSLLTLGIDSSQGVGPAVADLLAAATGLVVVGLQIAYLPTLYAAFNRREVLVTLLQSRAGLPAWGPEILARHQLVRLVPNLPQLYRDWEQWAADVAESHTTYPVLMVFRSPNALRSWVLALLAVLDAAALHLSLCPEAAPTDARLCIRMGFTCLRDLATVLELAYDPDPLPTDPVALEWEDFLAGVDRLSEAGFPMERSPEDAWPHFRAWRVNYEPIAYALADRTVAPPGPWSGQRRRIGTINPLRPLDRKPEDPQANRAPDGRWRG
ncbi:MAG: hypothetical protein ACYDAD_10510 [Acidimicrobiales bacterium]